MSDYFEPEDILKSYDADIMKRLLLYLKPYLRVFLFSLVALALATVGELFVPILLQRATDNHILPYYRGIRINEISPDIREQLEPVEEARLAEELYFLPSSKLVELNAKQKRELREQGSLLEENFFILEGYGDKTEARRVVADHGRLHRLPPVLRRQVVRGSRLREGRAKAMNGDALRILIDGTKLDAWLRVKLGQPPSEKKKKGEPKLP